MRPQQRVRFLAVNRALVADPALPRCAASPMPAEISHYVTIFTPFRCAAANSLARSGAPGGTSLSISTKSLEA